MLGWRIGKASPVANRVGTKMEITAISRSQIAAEGECHKALRTAKIIDKGTVHHFLPGFGLFSGALWTAGFEASTRRIVLADVPIKQLSSCHQQAIGHAGKK